MLNEKMIESLPGITRLAQSFKCILLDAYGVFWSGNETGLLPGAKEAMKRLVKMGKWVGVLSNSTQLPAKEIAKLEAHGLVLGKHFHFLITSGEVSQQMFLHEQLPFETPRKTFWLVGGVHPKIASHEAIFKDTAYAQTDDITQADFLYLSVPHIHGEDQTDPEVFREGLQALREKNLPMICPNPDRYAHEGSPPRAVVRQGSLAKMYEEMGGSVIYVGKPGSKAYQSALEAFEKLILVDPEEILMVGDTPETDIRGANAMGMATALILQTGIMADRIQYKGLEQAIKDLTQDEFPDYFIERLVDDL